MENKKSLFLPISILISGALVAGALVYNAGLRRLDSGQPAKALGGDSGAAEAVRPVGPDDHVRGDRGAPVKLIEFSDEECPFCKSVHGRLQQLVKEYDGKVAWVYRHFPLDAIHPKTRKEAEATECAAELGGNDIFWAYVDRIFEVTPSNNGLDPAELPKIARAVGLDQQKFEICLASGRHAARVAADLEDATKAGGSGTPYMIVIAKDGKKYPIEGALPYEQIKLIVDQALSG